MFLTQEVFGHQYRTAIEVGHTWKGAVGVTAADPDTDKATFKKEQEEIIQNFQQGMCLSCLLCSTSDMSYLHVKTVIISSIIVIKGPPDKDNKIRLDLPVGMPTVRGALKALVDEWKQQKASGRTKSDHPKDSQMVKTFIDQYERRLVSEKINTSQDRGANCALRDGYSTDKFVEMMAILWRPVTDKRYSILKDACISTRMSLAMRHQMCARDEDIRNSDLCDAFTLRIRKPRQYDNKQQIALILSLTRGKSVSTGTSQYAIALRHREFARCAVGAFAFHMFERIHVS